MGAFELFPIQINDFVRSESHAVLELACW